MTGILLTVAGRHVPGEPGQRGCRRRYSRKRHPENTSRPQNCCKFRHPNLLRFRAKPLFLVLEKRPRWRRRSDSPKRAIITLHLALSRASKAAQSNSVGGVTLLQQDGYRPCWADWVAPPR